MGDVNDSTIFSEVDALNNTINSPTFPESMLPSLVDDNMRALQGAFKRFRDWLCGGSTIGGTNNAITLTFTQNPTLLVKGDRYVFFPTAGNTSAVTLTVGTLASKSLLRNGAVLTGGELSVGVPVEVIYDGTAFQLMPFLTSFNKLGIGTNTPVVSTLAVAGVGASNWRTFIAGLGTSSSTFSLVIDDSAGAHQFYIRDDGVITFAKYGAGALFTDVIGDVGVGVLPVIYGGTGVQTSTGSGANVLNTNPVLRQTTISAAVQNVLQIDNGSGGNKLKFSTDGSVDTTVPSIRSDGTNLVINAKTNGSLYLNNDVTGTNTFVSGNMAVGATGTSSNWRQFINGQGTTSATYQLVCDNSAGAGCLWVRDDGVISFPSYANGTLQVSSGAVVSVTDPTFGNTTTSSIQCNGNFNATGNVSSNATMTATTAMNTTLYEVSGQPFGARASGAAGYNLLYDYNGNISIFLGGGTDNTNYYRNTNHAFGSINQGTLYGTWGAAGLNVNVGNLSVSAGGISCTGAISCGSISASSLAATGNIQASAMTLTAGGTALFANNGDIRAHGNLIADGNVTTNATVAFTGIGSSFVGYNGVDLNIALAGFDANNYLLIASATRNLVLNFDAGNFALYNGNGSSMSFSSDRKLKENIKSLTPNHVNKDADSFVGLLGQLKPVKFNFKADEGKKEQIGLIAQEVQEILPHLVSEGHDGNLGLAYGGLVMPLIAAVKELNDRLAKLEAAAKPTKKL